VLDRTRSSETSTTTALTGQMQAARGDPAVSDHGGECAETNGCGLDDSAAPNRTDGTHHRGIFREARGRDDCRAIATAPF
jgi:hypothetical protein